MLGTKMNFEKNGFTLLEITVVIFIIMLMWTIVLINYRQVGTQLGLNRSANKLAQDIRRAEEMATSTREYKGIVPLGGYGIYIKLVNEDINGDGTLESVAHGYTLFADCTDDGQANYTSPPATPCKDSLGNNYSEDIEHTTLEAGVWITGVYSGNTSTIVFTPPDPLVTLIPDPGSEGKTPVVLQNRQNQTKTIRINHAGLIYIE